MTAPAVNLPGAGRHTGARPAVPAGTRDRWRMGIEARALVLVTAVLMSLGLAVLFSASALVAVAKDLPGHYFVLRQAQGLVVGIIAFAIVAKMDAEVWRKLAWPGMIVALLFMIAVLFTEKVGGSKRFLFGGSIQPSELAKFAVIVWVPMLIAKKGDVVQRLGKGLMPFALVIGTLSGLAAAEPDLSVAMLYCLITAVLLFVAGARISHFLLFGLVSALYLGIEFNRDGYVGNRIRSFLNNEQATGGKPSATAVQQYQSLMAVGSGGVLGVGFGQGNQQRGWLPLSYNDFIGSIVGEELGLIGLGGLTLLYAVYGWLGFRIARQARSQYLELLAIGLTFTTVITALIHLGVVVGALPNTGLTLPFVSFGRSNLIITFVMTGILVNIGSERERVFGESATDPLSSGA